MFSRAAAAWLVFVAAPAFAGLLPLLGDIDGAREADSYIIKLKPGVNAFAHAASTQSLGSGYRVQTSYHPSFFKGYAARVLPGALEKLRANPDIEYIVVNSLVSINGPVVQTTAPWGLQAISTQKPVGRTDTATLNYTYTYDSSAGSGVDVYVVDTGINTAHVEFEGRARWGFAAGTFAQVDGHGHGTHCAGTIGSRAYGVSKNVSIIAVKVLDDGGSGSVADIVSGLQYVVNATAISGRPSVISMSLGGSANQALDDAVSAAIKAGITSAIAAGNSNVDAKNTSPARVVDAITVGASAIDNSRASFSNYGPIVDIFAPGVNIVSTWKGSTTATNSISGTSMATPHIAGLVAYILSLEGPKVPAAVAARLVELATPGVLTGLPSGTVNLLAYNGIGLAPPVTSTSATETSTELPSSTASSADPTTSVEPTPTTSAEPTPTSAESTADPTSTA